MKLKPRVVLSFTATVFAILVVAAAFIFRPDRVREERMCESMCAPRAGILVQDSALSHSFKPGWNAGPRICRCQ